MSIPRLSAASSETLVSLIREESDALLALLSIAEEQQWDVSPAPRPRDEEGRRVLGETSDPTARIALDERRLALREAVERVRAVLLNAAVASRASRLALEAAMARHSG